MKAAIYKNYGAPEVLHMAEVNKPEPKKGEVLVKIYATSVTAGDCRVRALHVPKGFKTIMRLMFGWNRPKRQIIGVEFAGRIEKLGSGSSSFKVGDRVYGISGQNMGCYAEYICVPEKGAIAHIPEALNFDEAAAISFGSTTALYFLRNLAKLKKGDSLLINGASGGVGTAAIQIAKYYGAKVTAVCSARNAKLVQSLGADYVIDYEKEDFTKNAKQYDYIMEVLGKKSFAECKASLKQSGAFLGVTSSFGEMLSAPFSALGKGAKNLSGVAEEKKDDLLFLNTLITAQKLKPHIDKVYPLEKIAEAHAYVETGRKRGNVVIHVAKD